ncbi:MAG TPA: FlgD immunoglobulin-like domain containing protein [Ignavibacteria bacterium]
MLLRKILYLILFFSFSVVAQSQQHFLYTSNTGNNAIISIPFSTQIKINNLPISIGDEIGVFTQDGICVGATLWNGNNTGITIWGDNDRTPQKDGLSYEERISYKIWKKSENKEYSNSIATYSTANIIYRSDGLYAPNAFYVLTSLYVYGAPFKPSLSYPSNGSSSLPPSITFTWSLPEVTNSFILQIALDTNFTNIIVNDTGITQNFKEINNLNKTTKYYWRVAAKNNYGISEWSDIWSFTTITEVADRPILQYPQNNAISVPKNTVLSWLPSARAQYYEIQIAFDSLFNMLFKQESGIINRYYVIDNLSNNVKYYWRVRAFNESGYSQFSDVFCFTTIPFPPFPIFPPNGQTNIQILPRIQWSSVQNAISYNLVITTNPNDVSAVVLNRTNITDTFYDLYFNLKNNQIYYWKVSATLQGGITEWSDYFTFKTKLSTPLLSSPQDLSTGISTKPIFLWEEVQGAQYYHIQIFDQNYDLSNPIFDLNGIYGTSFQFTSSLKGLKKYYWRLSAVNSESESEWSLLNTFTTANTTPEPPRLISPVNNASGIPLTPTFLWEQLENISYYHLQVSTNINNWNDLVLNQSNITKNNFTINNELQNYTVYYWRVAAANEMGLGEWSTPNKFTTRITDPIITYPINNSRGISVTPTINWTSVPGATSYNIQITNNLNNWSNPIINKTGITDNYYQLPTPLNYNTIYYIRVSANSIGGTSNYSNIISFTTTIGPVQLISPNNGSIGVSLTPTFVWSILSGATSYQLQISNKANDWTSPIIDEPSINTNTYILQFPLNYNTIYYWRVRGISSSEIGEWSAVRSFSTIISAPNLIYPSDNAKWVDLIPQFVWGTVTGATSYNLQLSTNYNDWNNLIINLEDIQGNTYISPVQLANNTTYYWRMSSNSIAGKSNWSTIKSFKTLPSYPSSIHLDYTFSFPKHSSISDYKSTEYKLIGLPGASNIPLNSIMKGTRSKDWNAFWDNGQSQNYMIEYDGTDIFKFSTGRGFWVISNSDITINKVVPSSTLNSNKEIELPLHPGWNIITNPFSTKIKWQLIQQKNNTNQPLWQYNGQFETTEEFEPYKAYYFDNRNNLSYLRIPYSFIESIFTSKNYNEIVGLDIYLYSENNEIEGKLTVGINDINDDTELKTFRKPIQLFKGNDIFLIKNDDPNNHYAILFKSISNDIVKWDFIIKTNTKENKSLTITNVSKISNNFCVYLKNNDNNILSDLRKDSTYTFKPFKENNSFSIIICTPDKLKDLQASISIPEKFELLQNYPNPFNPSTNIPIRIPVLSKISLKIYDILGKEITTIYNGLLEKGYYVFEWNGKDKNGNLVTTGLYFVKLNSPDNNINFIRKIILLR